MKNFVVGLVFIAAGVGGGFLGSYLSGGATWAIIGLALVGLVLGVFLAALTNRLLQAGEVRTREARRKAGAAAERGRKTLTAAFVLISQLSCLAIFLVGMPAWTRQSIVNNNVLGIIAGLLASLVVWGILGFLVTHFVALRKQSAQVQVMVGAGLALIVVAGLFAYFWTTVERKPKLTAEYWVTIAQACEGTGVSGARPFDEDPHLRRIVVLRGGRQAWYNDMALEWLPTDVESTELVACVGEIEKYTIEVCKYRGSPVTRYGYRREVRLVSALTGELISGRTFEGEPPRECRGSEQADLTELKGKDITFGHIREWLQGYVEP